MTTDEPTGRTAALRDALLSWFRQNARDLPWRRTRDPYRIMVSEIMLQQTQVDRVVPRYLAFLEQFPTLDSLALAPTGEVIRAWAGLGYNRRAVNMQRAARAVRDEHGGVFPREVAALRELPGIGPYTAGAIACFAYEQDVAFLDTNIRRVVRRACLPPGDPEPTERELTAAAAGLVPAGGGWEWNQAIMELGALVCTASSPACWRCPLRDVCLDYAGRRADDERALDGFAGGPAPAPRPARRVAERREAPFAGSARFYRGRIIAALRDHPAGLPTAELGALVKEGYGPDDAAWLEGLVAALARDGLVALSDGLARLPE